MEYWRKVSWTRSYFNLLRLNKHLIMNFNDLSSTIYLVKRLEM